MSTLSGVPTKGEKGKKFQSLDINSLYHTNRGESSDHHSQKNIVRANRHGMQPLGKVPSRRPPANLPSLKSEHSGNDPTVSLVPTGGTGWGSKPGETGPSPSSLQPNSQTAPTQTNLISQPHGTNAPAAAGNSAQPSNLSTQASTTQPPVTLKPAGSALSTGDKTWSSVTGGADQGPSFLAHQSPQFQQEFPSLSGEGAGQGLLRGAVASTDSSYGPGPSLRPQSEGSWILGGSTRSSTPQHPYFPQESGGIRNNLGQYGVGGGQGGLSISPPHSQISSMPFKPMTPFLVQHKTGSSSFPSGFPGMNPTRSSNSGPSENRFSSGGNRPPVGEEVDPIPIVKVEDINRIDEISRDTGWANQNVIDYNETLQFSDNESNGPDEIKEKTTKSTSPQKNYEKETDHEKHNEKSHQSDKPWNLRNTSLPHDYHPMRPTEPMTRHELEMDSEMQAKRNLKEKIAVFADKAHQRKEEEEQRFNHKKTMQENELKNKKDDYYTEKDEKPTKTLNKESDFRQTSQMDSRQNYNDRGEVRNSSYSVPPRFLKQRNEKNNQYMRQQPNDYFPNYNSEESRWQNHYKNRNDEDRDKDRMKDKDDDKEREQERERYNRGIRNDRGNEPNRKNYFENHGQDYRSQRNFEDRKEAEYRQREKEVEWEGRHGNSSFQDRHHPDDKNKRRNDGYSNKGHSSFVEDRESDVRDRPQRPESRDRPEHPSRPDSRDSRVSRESRNSRESTRDDPHSFSELSHNYSWDEKPRKKDYKEERENQTKREGFGPIKSEKFTAYNEKKEKSSTSLILTRNSMEDSRNKTGNVATSINSWGDPNENSQAQKASTPPTEQPSQQSDDQEIKDSDKKKDSGPIKENKNLRGTSNRGRGARQGGNLSGNNYSNFPSRGNWPRDNRKVNKPQKGQWNGSESEQSADDVSASTESGKEDKKVIERKQRSSRSGDRKKEKDERNRESKKSDDKNTHNRLDKKMLAPQQAPIGSGSNYDSNRRKEGFLPSGEPSKRGRGGTGFRMSRGGGAIGNVSGLYGPPGTKTPFPSHQHSENKNDDDKSNDKNHENDSQDEKAKHKSGASGITGFPRQNKDSRKDDGKNQKNKNKGKGNGEDWDTLSDESVDKNRFKHPGKGERKPQSRPVGDKTRGGPSNAMQINGRPSRSDEGKGEDQNVGEKKQALLDKDSDSFPNNGFQEVRNKKVGKEVRPMSKEDQKPRGNKESKGKPLGGPNSVNKTLPQTNKQPHQKREWSSNKPPRMQRLENSRQQQQQDVNDMNKMNQNVPLFSLPREVKCTAAPPPPTNAWDKPIVLNQSVSPPNSVHLSNVNSDKSGLEINDHQGGSQTGSPTADKALNKMSRDTVDKNMRHTVQTIIIQNTNYKAQSLDKPKGKLDEDIDQNHQMRLVSGYKDMKSNEKSQESLQMPMTFIKNEDNADMDFKFDSELSQLTEDKTTNIPHSILAQSSSAADLNQKIASVKKVWDAPGSVMEHPHHDENLGVVSTASSTFAANFSGVVDTSLDHSSVHQVDDSAFNNTDVYGTAPMQAAAGGYSNSANIMKQDAINPGSTPQPQQAVAIASGLNHSANLSSPPPQYNQTTHFNSYQQYSGIPAVPSPPTMISLGGGQPNDVFPFMMGNQATRTNFNQYTFGLNPPNVMSQTSGFGQQSALYHIPQAAGTNGPLPNDPFSQFRVTAPYAQSPQIPNNPTTVLITSSTANSSLMSASVKSSTQLGAIGSKAYQSPHPVVGYMPYGEPQMITQSYMRGTVPTMGTTPTSFYNSTVGQTPGIFQAQGSSLLTQAGNQTALPATYGFNTQSGNNSSSNVNQTSYNSQPGHFRGQTAGYLKPPVQTVQHPNDPSKLVSSNQDVLNSVFSGGGSTGQIPSPKSRTSGGNTNKPPPQQPSPTQTHQKFLNYPNQNLLQQGNAGQRANQASMYMRSQNNSSMLGNNNMGKIYNQPIQRPNFPSQMNSNQQNQLMQQQQQNRHQQRIPNSRQPTQQPQPHNKLISHHYFHQPGNSGKIEPGNIDAKVDTEKLQETNNAPKQDKKEETTSAEQ